MKTEIQKILKTLKINCENPIELKPIHEIRIFDVAESDENTNKNNCIYVWVNLKNNKKYVGLTTQGIRNRVDKHFRDVTNGRDHSLHRAIKKYGYSSFVVFVIQYGKDKQELGKLEEFFISKYHTFKDWKNSKGYNETSGGEVPKEITKEIHEKLSKSSTKMWQNPEYRKSMSKKLSDSYKNSPERIQILAERNKNKIWTQEEVDKIVHKNQKKIFLNSEQDEIDFVLQLDYLFSIGYSVQMMSKFFNNITPGKLLKRYKRYCKRYGLIPMKSICGTGNPSLNLRDINLKIEFVNFVQNRIRQNFEFNQIVKEYNKINKTKYSKAGLSKAYKKLCTELNIIYIKPAQGPKSKLFFDTIEAKIEFVNFIEKEHKTKSFLEICPLFEEKYKVHYGDRNLNWKFKQIKQELISQNLI